VDLAQRHVREQVALRTGRDPQAVPHVLGTLRCRERCQTPTYADALAQLTQSRRLEHHVEFGLSEQDDLDQLARLGLEVGEQPDLLQRLRRERLGFVHDEQDAAPGFLPGQEEFIELVHELTTALALGIESELEIDGLHQLLGRELGIEEDRDLAGRLDALEQGATQCGLAGAHLSADGDEAFALLDPEQ
jgi:hypothetical protein